MGMFQESLTVRILGDSSGLQRELNAAGRRLDDFRSRMEQIGSAPSRISRGFESLSAVSERFAAITDQIRELEAEIGVLNGTPVVIDVSAALANLGVLSAALAQVQNQVSLLSVTGGVTVGGGVPGVPASSGTTSGRRMAEGGLVTGPSGIDRVPTWLTAGEYVLPQPVVRELGLPFLSALHAGERDGHGARAGRVNLPPVVNQSATTNFGGITVQVREASDVGRVFRELDQQSVRLRGRRG